MIFPIGDTNVKGGTKPLISYSLIFLNIVIFIYSLTLGDNIAEFYKSFATIPYDIMQGNGYSTLLSNTFLHGGLLHLLGNMLFLWIFADNIEAIMGNFWFLAFYLCGGIFASLAHVLFSQASTIPSLGASGALSAIMGAYMIFFPKSQIKVLVVFLFKNFYVSAIYFLGLWFAVQLFSSFSEIGKDPNASGTAWWAHIGGFVFGLVVAYILKKNQIINPDNYYIRV